MDLPVFNGQETRRKHRSGTPGPAWTASEEACVDSGDTAFVLVAAGLVMFMTPGLALFYGGMVRAKNVLGTVMQSMFALGLVSVLWVLIGYTLAFGPDKGGLIGGLDYLGFAGVGQEPNADLAPTIPHLAYAAFQLMFAVITPALITGAFAERMRFSGYVAFTSLWLLLIYAPLAHWVWAPGGWIRELGALDFAGGTVVHMNSGVAALAAAIVIGKRAGFGRDAIVPHNLPLTVLGAGMLWFGWFGFNAGSALAANGLAASAFLATNTAAAAGAIGWGLFDVLRRRHHRQVPLRLRRRARRGRRARGRRHARCPADRPVRRHGLQQGRRRRAVRRRWPGAARQAGGGGPRDPGVLVRRQLRPAQGDQRPGRPAGQRR